MNRVRSSNGRRQKLDGVRRLTERALSWSETGVSAVYTFGRVIPQVVARRQFVSAVWLSRSRASAVQPVVPGSVVRNGGRNSGPGRPGWSPTQAPHRSGRARQSIRLFIS